MPIICFTIRLKKQQQKKMRFECIENNLINKRYQQDETERLSRRIEQIKTRKPVFARIENLPALPIIQSQKVARINNRKKLARENQKIASRILQIIQHGKSEYGYHPNSERLHKSLSPNSRIKNSSNIRDSGYEVDSGKESSNTNWKKKTTEANERD